MRDAITELVTSLREEGALVVPSPAPWGDRVSVSAATGVVEVSGRPERKAWPCVMLLGPAVLEERDRRAPHASERISEDRTAATMVVRPWPRSYTLSFEVVAQARAGHTASATSAYWEIVAMMQRFEEWLARTPKLSGSNLFSRAPLARGAARPTPANIHEARGSITLSPVFLYRGAAVTVDTARDIDLRAEPEAPGG